jgi:hypothetical protein
MKINEYTNSINNLENKIAEITIRAEACSKCAHMAGEEDYINTVTSVVDETMSKINPIPAIEIKSFMTRDSNEKEVDVKSDNNFDNIFLDDEGLGGMEYYHYLEKTVYMF